MKTFLCALFILHLGLSTAGAQNNCDAPPAVRAFYENDARQLAVRMMQNNPQWQDSVFIPANLYDRAMAALLAVYNAAQLPERDTVIDCLAIHTFPSVWPYGIALGLDGNETWAQNFAEGIFPTGNSEFDALLTHYGLSIGSSFEIGNQVYGSVTSEQALNPTPLIALFESVPGVNFAENENVFGDGNDIQLQQNLLGYVDLTYTYAWGDCPAGCIYERNWKFRVELDCSVTLVDVWGNALNEEVVCLNNFACTTEPLCLRWLRDTLDFYQGQFPECNQPYQGSAITLHESATVVGLHFVIGADFDFTNFYTCDGAYLGRCLTTIVGQSCDQPIFQNYLAQGDTIWTCDEPFPTLEECGVLGSAEAPSWAASVQITPNPSSGLIQVSALFDENTKGTVQVLNVLGQEVLRQNFQSVFLNESVDLQGVAPGIYLVRVQSGTQQVTKKVVVKKG